MAFGMHTIAHQIMLRVTEINGYGNQYMGKQEFNLNVIDLVLSPGDYNLEIEQNVVSKWRNYNKDLSSIAIGDESTLKYEETV